MIKKSTLYAILGASFFVIIVLVGVWGSIKNDDDSFAHVSVVSGEIIDCGSSGSSGLEPRAVWDPISGYMTNVLGAGECGPVTLFNKDVDLGEDLSEAHYRRFFKCLVNAGLMIPGLNGGVGFDAGAPNANSGLTECKERLAAEAMQTAQIVQSSGVEVNSQLGGGWSADICKQMENRMKKGGGGFLALNSNQGGHMTGVTSIICYLQFGFAMVTFSDPRDPGEPITISVPFKGPFSYPLPGSQGGLTSVTVTGWGTVARR